MNALHRLLFSLALAAPLPASAMTRSELADIARIGGEADVVVAARVTSAHALWNEDRSLLFTEYSAIPSRHWKGGEVALTFRLLGGESEGLGLVIPGETRVEVGRSYLLALRAGDDRVLEPVEAGAGPWRIDGDRVEGLELRLDDVADALEGRRSEPAVREVTCIPALATVGGQPLRWSGRTSEPFLIHPSPPSGCGSSSEWVDLVRAAAAVWNDVPIGFCFKEGGTTPLTTQGRQPDGRNVIQVGNARGAAALTLLWYDAATGAILEHDLVVDGGRALAWGSRPATLGAGQSDLGATLVHEFGHALGLADDDAAEGSVMAGRIPRGEPGTYRLSAADLCGARALYGDGHARCPAVGPSVAPVVPAHEAGPVPSISELMTAGPGAIRFSLREAGKVRAGVYDLAGRLVYSFPTLYLEPGTHTLRWGGPVGDGDVASQGLYFVRLRLADGASVAHKVVWTR